MWRVMKEPFGFGTQSPRGWVSYVFWAVVTLVSFVVSSGAVVTPMRALADGLFDLDHAIRVAALTGFSQDDLIPITLVEIDDATVQRWPMIDITPRKELTRLLQVVSSAGPAAMVVDIDLSDAAADKPGAQQAERELRQFLQSYREAAPIILVRRVILGGDGSLRADQNNLVKALAARANPHVSWAHALYITDEDGIVRRWQEAVRACPESGVSELLPAVPISVLAQAQWSQPVFARPAYAPQAGEPCDTVDSGRASHVIMFGDRLVGPTARFSTPSVMRVSAWQLTDRRVQREDDALFQGRVVIVGGTHERTHDSWRTPVGVMPGVELVANTVRFGAGQLRHDAEPVNRAGLSRASLFAMALFVVYIGVAFFLRPVLAVMVTLAATSLALHISLSRFGFYPVLDAVETGLLLLVQFGIFEAGSGLVRELRDQRGRALLAARFSEEPSHDGSAKS